jgi:hypothetical protein
MNPSKSLQTPEIGNDYYNAAYGVSPNAHHQDIKSSLFTFDHVDKPQPNAAQTLEDQHFEEPESQQPIFDCITQVWHQHIHLCARQLEEYSNEAHLSPVMAEFNILKKIMRQMNFPLTLKAKMMIVFSSFRTLQRPPSSQKILLERFLTVKL